jgi:hypothetical protein
MKVALGSSDRYGGFNRRMLGPAYLEATIRRDPALADRCEVVHLVFDGRVAPQQQIAEQVLASGCDVVGFGCYVWCTERAVAAGLVGLGLLAAREPAVVGAESAES